MHAILQHIFTKHVKDPNTYMPYREEDERSTEDKGKHIAKGSESEHNWEETGRKSPGEKTELEPSLTELMQAVTGHARGRASCSSSKYLQQCVANTTAPVQCSRFAIFTNELKKSCVVSILRELQHCYEVPARSGHLWTVKQMMH